MRSPPTGAWPRPKASSSLYGMSSTLWAQVNRELSENKRKLRAARRFRFAALPIQGNSCQTVCSMPRSATSRAGRVRHAQSAARDRQRRHLRLSARSHSAGFECRITRPRRRRGQPVSPCAASRACCSTCISTPCPIRRTGARTRSPCASTGDRAIGLGACDIKGAAAALVAAATRLRGDAAFLFSLRDEEANDARCIAAFLDFRSGAPRHGTAAFRSRDRRRAHPCEAVLAHRGISSVLMRFTGAGRARVGASSAAGDSALHQAMRWGARALAHVERCAHERFGGLTGSALQHRPHRRRHQGQHDRA